MNFSLIGYFWRSLRWYFAASVCVLLPGLILLPAPFFPPPDWGDHHTFFVWPAMLLGSLATFVCFAKPSGVAAWHRSLGLTQSQMFRNRIASGILLLLLVSTVLCMAIASGLRQWIQVKYFQSPWFPMVRWHELNFVGHFLLLAGICFCVSVFLNSTSWLVAENHRTRSIATLLALLEMAAAWIIAGLLMGMMLHSWTGCGCGLIFLFVLLPASEKAYCGQQLFQ